MYTDIFTDIFLFSLYGHVERGDGVYVNILSWLVVFFLVSIRSSYFLKMYKFPPWLNLFRIYRLNNRELGHCVVNKYFFTLEPSWRPCPKYDTTHSHQILLMSSRRSWFSSEASYSSHKSVHPIQIELDRRTGQDLHKI